MFASHSSSGGTSVSCSNCAGVRLCFLSGTRSIVHSFFKHDKKGDLFEALSRCYKQGIVHATSYVEERGGLPKDHMKAVEWWHKAADQGYAPAQELFSERW